MMTKATPQELEEPVGYVSKAGLERLKGWFRDADAVGVIGEPKAPRDIPLYLSSAPASDGTLREALEFYANPEIYKPHPHGSAFDERDLSWIAKKALANNLGGEIKSSDGTASAEGRALGPDPCVGKARDIQKNAAGIAPGPSEATQPERIHHIKHDGFVGVEIGSYTTLEGKHGVVLQQVGTKVVHVYGRKWLKDEPASQPEPEPETVTIDEVALVLGNHIRASHRLPPIASITESTSDWHRWRGQARAILSRFDVRRR